MKSKKEPEEQEQQGLYLVPTFSPPVLCPSRMNLHQKLQMMFDVHSYQPKPTLTKKSISKDLASPIQLVLPQPPIQGTSNKVLSLFDGALSYESKEQAENCSANKITQSSYEQAEKPAEKPAAGTKRAPNINHLLNSDSNKKQKHSEQKRAIYENRPAPVKSSIFAMAEKVTHPQHPLIESAETLKVRPTPFQKALTTSSTVTVSESSESGVVINDNNDFSQEDFMGIQNVCKNAGASVAGLSALTRKCKEAKTIQIAFVYKDLSCSHAPSTTKFCKPSGKCQLWYCSCDKVIRAAKLKDAIFSAVLIIVETNETFFLPLVNCIEPAETSNTVKSQKTTSRILPFRCETNLYQRFEFLFNILQDETIVKILFHAQAALLSLYAIAPSILQSRLRLKRIFDPKVAAYLTNSDESLELYELFTQYKVHFSNKEDIIDGGKVTRILQKVSTEGRALLELSQIMTKQLSNFSLSSLFWEIEMPLTYCLSLMEFSGVHILTDNIDQTLQILQKDLQQTEHEIYRLSGFKFNISSPEQVSNVLYERLHILESSGNTKRNGEVDNENDDPSLIKIQKRQRHLSTSEEELKKVLHLHPVVEKILHYRAIMKLLSTYIDGLTPFIVPNSGAGSLPTVHAYWNQTGVRTGRLSCCKPNLQNIPSNQKVGDQLICIRNFFSAKPGFIFLAADYSQIEVRILAHVCQDPIMIELFHNEHDIYRQLASKILSLPIDQVPESERNKAKTICLGILYGMGAPSAAQKLGIDVQQANQIITSFFNKFKHVRKWMDNIKSQTKEYHLVKTLTGRIRHLPDINSPDNFKRSAAERQAINSIIQGTASDIIKYAMITMEDALQYLSSSTSSSPPPPVSSEGLMAMISTFPLSDREELAKCSLVMQIHDELIFEIPDNEEIVPLFTRFVREIMEREVMNRFHFSVPLKTNISIGKRWGELVSVAPSSVPIV